MLHVLVLLAQMTVTSPALSPQDEALIATTVPLGNNIEMTVMRNAQGEAVRAIVRRTDGKQMTCDPYFAWVTHDYACDGCANGTYTVYGHAGGTSRSNACANAKADGCAYAVCNPGTYSYCQLIEAVSGVYYDAGGTCGYQLLQNCGGSTYTAQCN